MRIQGFLPVALFTAASQLLACSSGDTVVAANLRSSNDTQYNSATQLGQLGGLLEPGIPENILHPDRPGAPSTLRKATKVRITIKLGSLMVSRDVVPVGTTFEVDQLDGAGMPVLNSEGGVVKVKRSGIANSYERIVLGTEWNDGQADVTGEALDERGEAFFSAVPVKIDLQKGEATAAFLNFLIPSPPAATDGGVGSDGATTSEGGTEAGVDARAETGTDAANGSEGGADGAVDSSRPVESGASEAGDASGDARESGADATLPDVLPLLDVQTGG